MCSRSHLALPSASLLAPILGPVFVSLLASSAGAQTLQESAQPPRSPGEHGQRLRAGGTPSFAEMDLDTGVVVHQGGGAQGASQAISMVCFDNSIDDDNFADALLYPVGDELFDWGLKTCGESLFVDRIRVGYASTARPTNNGGPGASFILRVYEGATGNGVPGNLIHEVLLTGLPSEGRNPSGTLLIPWYVNVNLGAQSFFLPDGPIGWSYENTDGRSAPLLVDVDPSVGTANAYDVYSPGPASAASYSGTFTLGPGGASNDPKENSFYLRIFQNDVTAQAVPIPAGSNPNLLVTSGPIVGNTWRAHVDLTGLPGVQVSLMAVSQTRQAGLQTPMGLLIIDPTSLLTEVSIGVLDSHVYAIPIDPNLLGTMFYAQGGYHTSSGLQLTDAAELTIGSY